MISKKTEPFAVKVIVRPHLPWVDDPAIACRVAKVTQRIKLGQSNTENKVGKTAVKFGRIPISEMSRRLPKGFAPGFTLRLYSSYTINFYMWQ